MKYTKKLNEDGCLLQIDKGSADAADGMEITYTEYRCTLAGIRIFLGKENKEKVKKELFPDVV